MATRKEHSEFAAALAELTADRPDLAARLGDDPTRAQLLDALEDLAPAVAPGAKNMPKAGLVQLIAALAPAPQPPQLVSFTTRIPEALAQEVKAEAVARGVPVQALVADLLRAGLEQSR
ncbi:hypothetical protein [Corynebacterium sp. HMSC074E01]|uniref:hypothetical protein n=1 Tax=Corynebacterium sp. HMSC074E01 TaxID=1715017 RepID=UPI0008A586A9|nr:hypothetical protein [Corynebacterium sp. HMSC074E01]OFN78791.1 hypothetical protein HMPREF2537_00630 [Corynebacterium sp. HMSC074E01]